MHKFFIVILLLVIPQLTNATINKLVFTNEPLTVAPNTISDQLTVQLQDASGTKENTGETMDVVFESTSGTGEFLNSTGGVVSKTMNTGTANKNFFYRDSVSGSHLLTVTATGRNPGSISYTATQNITVGSGGSSSDTNTDSGDSGSVAGDSTSSSSSGGGGGDNHQSYVIESTAPGVEAHYASAGRTRTGSVGVPIEFAGWVSETKTGDAIRNAKYEWSFGDGSYGDGTYERHTYRTPGDYVVVLRGYYNNKEAISRTTVKILSLSLEISSVSSDSIILFNNSLNEVNLGEVLIVQGYNKYFFPRDTIVLPKSKITLYPDILWFVPGNVSMYILTPDGVSIDTWEPTPPPIPRDQILAMSGELAKLEREAKAMLPTTPHLATRLLSGNSVSSSSGKVLSDVTTSVKVVGDPEMPQVREVVVTKKQNFFMRLINKLFK